MICIYLVPSSFINHFKYALRAIEQDTSETKKVSQKMLEVENSLFKHLQFEVLSSPLSLNFLRGGEGKGEVDQNWIR